MSLPRIAMITGAAKGIGLETARLLGSRGFTVIVAGRGLDRVKAAVAELNRAGSDARPLRLDVTDEASVMEAVEAVAEDHGRLDVLVNNAAILLDRANEIGAVPVDILRETLETNVTGVWQVTQAFLPLLGRSTAPRIINVSSGAGQLSSAGNWAPAYSVSKTALNGITVQLAVAMPRFAVNSVSPGWCRTDMGGPGATHSAAEGADSIVWLADEAPQHLTGKFIQDRKVIAW